MIKGRDLICISPGYWDSPWITHQQIMKLLAAENRVLYVEPPLSYLPFRYPERWKKFTAFGSGVRQEQDHLWITTCPPALPFKRTINILNQASQQAVLRWTRRAARQLALKDPILWIFLPTAHELAGQLGESFLLYHCIDEFSAVGWGRRALIDQQEKKLLARADLVVTCSEPVFQTKAPWCNDIINVPNGVDFEHYHQALKEEMAVPAELNFNENGARGKRKMPVIGFSGVLDDRIDEPMLAAAADRFADCRFVLVGPARKSFRELERKVNVELIGNRPLSRLPGYLKGFDVCLIPYRMNDFVRNISPTKLYEYLAAGKPVVAPDILALEKLGELVYVGHNQQEMLDMIARALDDSNAHLVERRVELARDNTWTARAEAISGRIMEIESGRPL